MTAHLLALLRELRGMIYPDLSHKVEFNWLWKEADEQFAMCGPTFYTTVAIQFDSAPTSGVLAAHSRLRNEYLEEKLLTQLSVTLTLRLSSIQLCEMECDEDPDTRAAAAFQNVKHATIFVECERSCGGTSITAPHEANVHELIARFLALAPDLLTLRVAFHQPLWRPKLTVNLSRFIVPAAQRAATNMEFLPILPNTLGSLARVQRGEGYRVGHGTTIFADEFGFAVGQINAWGNPDDLMYVTCHEIQKLGVWSYAKGTETGRTWTEEEILEQWPVDEYPRDVLHVLGDEKAEACVTRSEGLVEWKET
jgi:hypothetical protein